MFEKPKFIIQNNELKMGRVLNHSNLAEEGGGKVLGGGMWYFDIDSKIMYLYGKSYDYGKVSIEDFENIWVRPVLEKVTIYFSTEELLEFAKTNNITVQDFNDERSN